MAKRNRILEIAEKKRKGAKPWRGYYHQFERLQKHWERVRRSDSDTDDFFVIRAVTLLEVFSRDYLARLIDQGSPYAQRAVKMELHLKIDLELLQSVQERVLTMGDIVAHNISVSSFPGICSAFDTILGESLVALISPAMRKRIAWKPKEEPKKIISDAKAMQARLVRLFEIRNILCHEVREEDVYDGAEITALLAAAEAFAAAMCVTLDRVIHGDVPDTIEGRIEVARRELKEGEDLLAEVYGRVDGIGDRRHSRLLTKSQRTWDAFREAQSAFRGDSARGAIGSTLLSLSEADDLIQQRIDSLRRFLPDVEDSE